MEHVNPNVTLKHYVEPIKTLFFHAFMHESFFLKENIHVQQLYESIMKKLNDDISNLDHHPKIDNHLISIFNELALNESTLPPLYVIPREQPIFQFTSKKSYDEKYQQELRLHLTGFLKDVSEIVTSHDLSIHKLYALIKYYGQFLPIITNEKITTTSIYDDFKLKSAIAQCGDHELAVVEYDLSGVQEFIYRITEGENTKPLIAKSLRGRSFYLSLLNDWVGYYILNAFHLSYENLLLSAGGRGQILIPVIDHFDEIWNAITKKIEKILFDKHQTTISLVTTVKKIERIYFEKDYDQVIDVLDEQLSTGKKRKYSNLIKDHAIQFIQDPIKHQCPMCGEENDRPEIYCSLCECMLSISQILTENTPFSVVFDYHNEYQGQGLKIKMGDSIIILHDSSILDADDHLYYQSINHHTLGESRHYANMNAQGRSFGEIASLSKGDSKIAVIKMDVDNLGLIFAKGINNQYKSFEKMLVLSRSIDTYFTYHMIRLFEQKGFHQKIYVNYAGGDDMVLICPASDVLQTVDLINKAFIEYTGRPDIHLSSGIEIFSPQSPFRFAVLKADKALSDSKSMINKNACTLLSTTISHNRLNQILHDVDEHVNAYMNNQLSKSTLYYLYSVLLQSIESIDPVVRYQPFIPLIAYQIERNISHRETQIKLKQRFIRRDITMESLQESFLTFALTLLQTRK